MDGWACRTIVNLKKALGGADGDRLAGGNEPTVALETSRVVSRRTGRSLPLVLEKPPLRPEVDVGHPRADGFDRVGVVHGSRTRGIGIHVLLRYVHLDALIAEFFSRPETPYNLDPNQRPTLRKHLRVARGKKLQVQVSTRTDTR